MKEFFAKGLSGRKIELDEVIEPEQDDQSSTTSENVLEAATELMAPAPMMRADNHPVGNPKRKL
jgi:hypothetical protein